MSDQVTKELIRQLADLRERLARLEGSEYIAKAGVLGNASASVTKDGNATFKGGLNVGSATGAGTGEIKTSGAARFAGGYITGIGKSVSKSVANNTATNIADLVIGGVGPLLARYLVTLTGDSANVLFVDTYLVSQEYNETTVTRLGSLAEFAGRTSSVNLTATATPESRKITLAVTQVNTYSETVTVRTNVVPLGVAAEATITVTGL